MGQVGSPRDNAAIESFLSLLQNNVSCRPLLVHPPTATNHNHHLDEQTCYRRRRHLLLGSLTTIEYKTIMTINQVQAAKPCLTPSSAADPAAGSERSKEFESSRRKPAEDGSDEACTAAGARTCTTGDPADVVSWCTVTWGWNPDTVAALGTALATLLAAFAAYLAVRDLVRRRQDKRRMQAMQIAAWTEVDQSEADHKTGEGVRCNLRVVNRSDLPVTNLTVRTSRRMGSPDEIAYYRIVALGPGEEFKALIFTTTTHDALGYPGQVLELQFEDHAGFQWIRKTRDGLNEVRSGE